MQLYTYYLCNKNTPYYSSIYKLLSIGTQQRKIDSIHTGRRSNKSNYKLDIGN